ncbi:Hydroxyneurosporene synthase (CrtC) [Caballeronia catudaia]|uniref:Hydroxyneurosporene synthase (CrtC) n=1 Tax=Caballeronia catudaia TaxID=1777136 RepID=A0A157ZNS1_9BURK|nr:carotenoid 1,2-hydratase [Caballeronia catudaia]SAK47136.1 Hydroxyneurosporene synthase (CrtC) [Caballeronia catudaia]
MRALLLMLLFSSTIALAEAPAFAPVVPGQAIRWPQDSGAHPAYRTEWWYATGWLETPDHQPLGFQITFFRSNTGKVSDAKAGRSAFDPSQLIIAHAALSDPAHGRLVHDQNVARQGFGLAYAKAGNTDVKLDAWRMTRASDGSYSVIADAAGFALHLTFTPTQPPMIQGEGGYSRKGPRPEQASWYYSEPQLRVTGSVTRPSTNRRVDVTGRAWLDHEWSSTLLSADAAGWDWLGANLDDGSALMAFKVRARDGHAVWAHAALRGSDGATEQFGPGDVEFTPERQWRSPRTNTVYPVAMNLRVGGMRWRLSPLIDDQELDSRDSTGALYWEGAVTLDGDGGRGRGYLELTGYAKTLEVEKR